MKPTEEFTENEIKLALHELVENGELKAVYIDGEIKYVEPNYHRD